MKITSWNCHYGFTEKENVMIGEISPDVLIIQECHYHDCIALRKCYKNIAWYGDGKDSVLGIGVFSNKYTIELSSKHFYDSDFRYIVPYILKGNSENYTLFSVWTKKSMTDDTKHCLSYIENIHAAIDYYKEILGKSSIIIGDFNSNQKWDNDYKKENNHSALVEKLKKFKMNDCAENYEKKDTYYYIYKGKAYSVIDDYCFVSEDIIVKDFEIGDPEKYLEYSDHCPITITIN
jgi:exonuclease III